eukprot:TRINITY_DN7348_c0_g1_i4.p1 TRINITY_DN7348_c0_g1~~TRINITY_DN7348_c0_g1_i4.p1  ORF type:complete len:1049 (+),score=197.68 TRINITY_DN7348_c0_g1_i4:91-3237(+)
MRPFVANNMMYSNQQQQQREARSCTKWTPIFVANLVAIIIIGLALSDVFYDLEKNNCMMTYMYPNYFEIPVRNRTNPQSRYRLHLYREGGLYSSMNTTQAVQRLQGVPVLFIPGNAGCYKQVRSVAAESTRLGPSIAERPYVQTTAQAHKPKLPPPSPPPPPFLPYPNSLDFFTIDFIEELSALNGHVLARQTEYVNDCIDEILALYREANQQQLLSYPPPTSVILLGHSMGGLVARATVTLPNYTPGSVETIFMLNSPTRAGPIFIQRSIADFYHNTNTFWVDEFAKLNVYHDHHISSSSSSSSSYSMSATDDSLAAAESSAPTRADCPPVPVSALANMTIVSICGGHRDTLIRSELASLDGLVPSSHGLSILTTSMPEVWLEADHECILWCNQMLVAMLRGMLALPDTMTKQNTRPQDERMRIIRDQLYSGIPDAIGILPPPSESDDLDGAEDGLGDGTVPNTIELGDRVEDNPILDACAKRASKIRSQPESSFADYASTREVILFDLATSPDSDSFAMVTSIPTQIDQATTSSLPSTQPTGTVRAKAPFKVVLFTSSFAYGLDVTHHIVGLPASPSSSRTFRDSPPASTFINISPSILTGYRYVVASVPAMLASKHYMIYAQFYNESDASVSLDGVTTRQSYTFPIDHPLIIKFAVTTHHKHFPFLVNIDRIHREKETTLPPYFLPVTYQYTPQIMLEEKFTLNASNTKIKFHQSSSDVSYVIAFLDPATPYSISVSVDWRGTVGRLFRAYASSVGGMTVGLFLLIQVAQLNRWKRMDEYPHLMVALRDVLRTYAPLALVLVPVLGMLAPILWPLRLIGKLLVQFFYLDANMDKFMMEQMPPYWVIPGLFIGAIAILSFIGLVTWVLFLAVQQVRIRPPPAPPCSVESMQGSCLPSWPMFVVMVVVMVSVHSVIALLVFNVWMLLRSSHSDTKLRHYQHTVFVMYILCALYSFTEVILWVKNLPYTWLIWDGMEPAVLVMILHIWLAMRQVYTRMPQALLVVLFVCAGYVMTVGLVLSYRAFDALLVGSASMTACHLLSLKVKNN